MAEFGLRPEDIPADEVEIWPENVPVKNAFVLMGTQWRMGFSGPIGLDYGVLPVVFRSLRIPRSDQIDVFDGVRVMETAVLELLSRK